MKTDAILKRLIMFMMVFAAVTVFSAALILEVYADVITRSQSAEPVYNVVPRMPWSLNKNQSGMHTFTFGHDLHPFRFDPIDISKMEFLEFDIYLQDPETVYQWKAGETEFEITSSGTCDLNEYAWSGYELWREAARNGLELREGWNHVKLNLPKNSPADLSKINYIRWYWAEDDENKKCPAAGSRI